MHCNGDGCRHRSNQHDACNLNAAIPGMDDDDDGMMRMTAEQNIIVKMLMQKDLLIMGPRLAASVNDAS